MPTLAEKLKFCTGTCTGGSYNKLVQSDEILKNNIKGHDEGICLGISMAWLGMCRNGVNFGKEKPFQSTWKFITRIQVISEREGDDLVKGKLYAKSWAKAWEATGFRYAGVHMAPFTFDSIGRYVARIKGAYMLKVPNHAMAAYNSGDKYRFLDPNAGQAFFQDKDEFWLCLARYFCDSYVASTYDLEGPRGVWKNSVIVYRLD